METKKYEKPDGDFNGLPEVAEASWLGEHYELALRKAGATEVQVAFGAEQRARKEEFLRSDAGKAFVELLDQRDAVLSDIAWQTTHPLPSVLDQRATIGTLTTRLGEVEAQIAADEQPAQTGTAVAVSTATAACAPRTAPARGSRASVSEAIRPYIAGLLLDHSGTVKDLYRRCREKAGSGDSPFAKSGDQYANLCVAALGKPVALQTMQNLVSEIRKNSTSF